MKFLNFTRLRNGFKTAILTILFGVVGLTANAQTNLFQIIENSPDHIVLEEAIIKAGLQTTIENFTGTVFAPTDAAFTAAGIDLDQLTSGSIIVLLEYHLLPTAVLSGDFTSGTQLASLLGINDKITVQFDNGDVLINNQKVSAVDLQPNQTTDGSQGVVHVIDGFLSTKTATVVDIIVNSVNHTLLETLLINASLVPTLSGPGEFTVFAPTDQAIAALGSSLSGLTQAEITEILKYHVLSGDVRAADLSDGLQVPTLEGSIVEFTLSSPDAFINGKKITVTNLVAGNGVVHVIDAVLLPSEAPLGFNSFVDNDVVSVFPNPAKNVINVQTNESVNEVVLFDMAGNEIKSFQSIDGPLNINDIKPGSYILQIISNDKGLMKKVVVQ